VLGLYEKSPNPSTNSGFFSNMLFTVSIVWDVHSQSPTAAKLKSGIRDDDDDAADAYAKFWCWCCFFVLLS